MHFLHIIRFFTTFLKTHKKLQKKFFYICNSLIQSKIIKTQGDLIKMFLYVYSSSLTLNQFLSLIDFLELKKNQKYFFQIYKKKKLFILKRNLKLSKFVPTDYLNFFLFCNQNFLSFNYNVSFLSSFSITTNSRKDRFQNFYFNDTFTVWKKWKKQEVLKERKEYKKLRRFYQRSKFLSFKKMWEQIRYRSKHWRRYIHPSKKYRPSHLIPSRIFNILKQSSFEYFRHAEKISFFKDHLKLINNSKKILQLKAKAILLANKKKSYLNLLKTLQNKIIKKTRFVKKTKNFFSKNKLIIKPTTEFYLQIKYQYYINEIKLHRLGLKLKKKQNFLSAKFLLNAKVSKKINNLLLYFKKFHFLFSKGSSKLKTLKILAQNKNFLIGNIKKLNFTILKHKPIIFMFLNSENQKKILFFLQKQLNKKFSGDFVKQKNAKNLFFRFLNLSYARKIFKPSLLSSPINNLRNKNLLSVKSLLLKYLSNKLPKTRLTKKVFYFPEFKKAVSPQKKFSYTKYTKYTKYIKSTFTTSGFCFNIKKVNFFKSKSVFKKFKKKTFLKTFFRRVKNETLKTLFFKNFFYNSSFEKGRVTIRKVQKLFKNNLDFKLKAQTFLFYKSFLVNFNPKNRYFGINLWKNFHLKKFFFCFLILQKQKMVKTKFIFLLSSYFNFLLNQTSPSFQSPKKLLVILNFLFQKKILLKVFKKFSLFRLKRILLKKIFKKTNKLNRNLAFFNVLEKKKNNKEQFKKLFLYWYKIKILKKRFLNINPKRFNYFKNYLKYGNQEKNIYWNNPFLTRNLLRNKVLVKKKIPLFAKNFFEEKNFKQYASDFFFQRRHSKFLRFLTVAFARKKKKQKINFVLYPRFYYRKYKKNKSKKKISQYYKIKYIKNFIKKVLLNKKYLPKKFTKYAKKKRTKMFKIKFLNKNVVLLRTNLPKFLRKQIKRNFNVSQLKLKNLTLSFCNLVINSYLKYRTRKLKKRYFIKKKISQTLSGLKQNYHRLKPLKVVKKPNLKKPQLSNKAKKKLKLFKKSKLFKRAKFLRKFKKKIRYLKRIRKLKYRRLKKKYKRFQMLRGNFFTHKQFFLFWLTHFGLNKKVLLILKKSNKILKKLILFSATVFLKYKKKFFTILKKKIHKMYYALLQQKYLYSKKQIVTINYFSDKNNKKKLINQLKTQTTNFHFNRRLKKKTRNLKNLMLKYLKSISSKIRFKKNLKIKKYGSLRSNNFLGFIKYKNYLIRNFKNKKSKKIFKPITSKLFKNKKLLFLNNFKKNSFLLDHQNKFNKKKELISTKKIFNLKKKIIGIQKYLKNKCLATNNFSSSKTQNNFPANTYFSTVFDNENKNLGPDFRLRMQKFFHTINKNKKYSMHTTPVQLYKGNIVTWPRFLPKKMKKKEKKMLNLYSKKTRWPLIIFLAKSNNNIKTYKKNRKLIKYERFYELKFSTIMRRALKAIEATTYRGKRKNKVSRLIKFLNRNLKKKINSKIFYQSFFYRYKIKEVFKKRRAARLKKILKLKFKLQIFFKLFYNYKTNHKLFSQLQLKHKKKKIKNIIKNQMILAIVKKKNIVIKSKNDSLNKNLTYNFKKFKTQNYQKIQPKTSSLWKPSFNPKILEKLEGKLILEDLFTKSLRVSKFIADSKFKYNVSFLHKNFKTKTFKCLIKILKQTIKKKKKFHLEKNALTLFYKLPNHFLHHLKKNTKETFLNKSNYIQLFKFKMQKKNTLENFLMLESQLNILLFRMKLIPKMNILPKIFFYNLVFVNNKTVRNPFKIINIYDLIQVPYILTKKFYFYALTNLKSSKNKTLTLLFKNLKKLYHPFLTKIWLPTYFTCNLAIAAGFLHSQPTFENFSQPLIKITRANQAPLRSAFPLLPNLSKMENKKVLKLRRFEYTARKKRNFIQQGKNFCLVKLHFFNFLDFYNKY